MKELLSAIDRYLFDIIGIMIPGLIALFMLFCFGFIYINSEIWKAYELLNHNEFVNVILILILLYLVGTIVKVLAIKSYELIGSLNLRSIISLLESFKGKLNKRMENINKDDFIVAECSCSKFLNFLFVKVIFCSIIGLLRYLSSMLITILNFNPTFYGVATIDLYSNLNNLLKEKGLLKIGEEKQHVKNNAHLIYKMAATFLIQGNVNSLYDNFLAKYNFFRSIAFIFLTSGFIAIFREPIFQINKTLYVTILFILWFVFHYKYLRYWRLCGDDAIISALIYLNKRK